MKLVLPTRLAWRASTLSLLLAALVWTASGQDISAEENNGTNPTQLTTQMGLQYQYNQVNSSLNTGLLEAFYSRPLGAGNKSLQLTVPFSDSSLNNNDLELGDVSLKFTDVFFVSKTNGAAYSAELFLDTANSKGNGYGQFALETSLFYAWFLKNAIFAPAWVQTFGLEGGSSGGAKLNQTTFDFYYVPKLANPRFYMTWDPAIVHDWENDLTFGSLQVTLGMIAGKAFGGTGQFFIKPGVTFGGDSPSDWSVQVGYKVLNF